MCCLNIRFNRTGRDFFIRPGFDRLAAARCDRSAFRRAGGSSSGVRVPGRSGLVPLDPRWYQAARRFVEMGFLHILDGTDHLLFLCCLVIPFRKFVTLVGVVTAFTVAHSITLIASASGLMPDRSVVSSADRNADRGSIVYMAFENIVGASTKTAMDRGVRVRTGSWFRLFLRTAREPATRRHHTCSLPCLRSTSVSNLDS